MNHIGNSDCKHNAYSSYLRCAINPCGPCEGCQDYARASLGDRLKHFRSRNIPIIKDILLGASLGTFVGVPLGLLLAATIVIPALNQMIVETHPCRPVLGVNQSCSSPEAVKRPTSR
jgi:Family of unknown function (DUF6464)